MYGCPLGGHATVAQRAEYVGVGGRRDTDMDKVMAKLGPMPRILCWKCRKLTPFELDHCQHCGSAFAAGTGGAYGSGRSVNSRVGPGARRYTSSCTSALRADASCPRKRPIASAACDSRNRPRSPSRAPSVE